MKVNVARSATGRGRVAVRGPCSPSARSSLGHRDPPRKAWVLFRADSFTEDSVDLALFCIPNFFRVE